HGRALFAPVAARRTSGTPPWEMGPEVAPHRLATVSACVDGDELVGRVVFVDHFGNLVSNLDAAALAGAKTVRVAGNTLPIVARYAEVEKGQLLGLVSSFQTLEIAQRDGSASETLGVAAGLEIRVPLPRR
ncbi:MAG TPA: SAM-dependent chlorinase/fluorinase, partial [Polyangiaceae bacterium]|nr:SAM-dependent chlorinase/fluorinase [Polyangiaceae bacterium]